MNNDDLLKIGYVTEIEGRRVSIFVYKEKNSQHIFYNGELIKNVGVGNYIEIRKGFSKLIGKIDGEYIKEEDEEKKKRKFTRILRVSINGFINSEGIFENNPNELPLIGNEAYIITNNKLKKLHNLASKEDYYISIGKTVFEDLYIQIPIDKLFSSHIAIFGNTGSGKSNTLAKIYGELLNHKELKDNNNFKENCNFLLLDFNGEYSSEKTICENKNIIKLSTHDNNANKIEIEEDYILDESLFSILCDARDKTQKPFISRVLKRYKKLIYKKTNEEKEEHFKNLLRKLIKTFIRLPDVVNVKLLLDYTIEILYNEDNDNEKDDIISDIEPHQHYYRLKNSNTFFSDCEDSIIENLIIYKKIDEKLLTKESFVKNIIDFSYVQLIIDILSNRTKNDFIAPLINRLKSRLHDIDKTISLKKGNVDNIKNNFTVIDLKNVNSTMKKILPLLVCKYRYEKHKKHYKEDKYLNIIIDEAHNILSEISSIESEIWKDYRLETFEEIIKEGRKFGIFITLASQRPMDISKTLISQAHNYFIHKLVNQQDLQAVKNSISYIDKISEEYIPNLPVGTCIFSGTITPMPILIKVDKLENDKSPKSETIKISDIVKEDSVPF